MLGLLLVLVGLPSIADAFADLSFATRDEDLRVVGRDAGDEIGASIAVGDVNGDTFDDILIGTPNGAGPSNNRPKAGEVALILGAFDLGTAIPPATLQIENAPRTFYGPDIEARLGHAVAIGDINDDGIGDIVMGSPEFSNPAHGEGAVYVFFGGNPLPGSLRTDLLGIGADLNIWGTKPDGRFGNALTIGDFNDDGIDDIASAAPREGETLGRIDGGNVYIFFGNPDLVPGTEVSATATGLPDSAHIMQVRGPTFQSIAGQALATGDVNGDQIDDLLIGAPRRGGSADVLPGAVYVVFGGPTFRPARVLDLAVEADLTVIGPGASNRFAISVAAADINGNGVSDLLIGAPRAEFSPGVLTGRAYAIYGRSFTRGTTINLGAVPANVTLAGPADQADLGRSMAGGDINDDGIDDWIVGAQGADQRGQAYRIAGRTTWSPLGAPGAFTMGARPGDAAGATVAVGDVNGDDFADVLVGSPLFDGTSEAPRSDSGAVYLVLGTNLVVDRGDCTDLDGDGYASESRTCGPRDCNDNNFAINPRAVELCDDGIDNDCDGAIDRVDTACGGPGCDFDNPETACSDGLDNDCDRATDGIDTDCGGAGCDPEAAEICTDGIDNDCDLAVDGHDPECGGTGCTSKELLCNDALDNDCDGATDHVDSDCSGTCNPDAPENCFDGVDNDCDLAVDGLDRDCGGIGCRPSESQCDDGIDNDCDGATDGFDLECGGNGCDVNNPAVDPNGPEDCFDGIDNNCNRAIDHVDTGCGGFGCDLLNPLVDPDGPEVCDDGIDNDCDGAIDAEDVFCGGSGVAPTENCSNCVDDDHNGLTDMLDRACSPVSLTLKTAVAKLQRKSSTMIKKITVKTALPDAALLNEATVGRGLGEETTAGTGATIDSEISAGGVIVGLAFDDGVQFCLPLAEVTQRKKGKLTTFSNQLRPRGTLKVKRTRKGGLKAKYTQKGALELPSTAPQAMAFGIYSAEQPYRGVAGLRTKGRTRIVGESE